MSKFLKKLRKGQKGFTLIELLVVVAILGVLAAVAIPNLIGFIGEGQEEAKTTELSIVQTSVVAAMAADQVGTLTAVTMQALVPADAGTDENDARYYLITTTEYEYSISSSGVVVQSDDPAS